MAKIQLNELVRATNVVNTMDKRAADDALIEINAQQPHLLGAVVTLKQLGHEEQYIQVLLKVLTVTHLALQYSGLKIARISEAQIKTQLAEYVAHFSSTEGLDGPAVAKALQDYTDYHQENYLMTFVSNAMFEGGIPHLPPQKGKWLVMTGTAIVNCVTQAIH
jgi:hypothetical protein